ncbi:MAG: energy-coupled thiamine transporter ThiT [Thermofilaceae archaeon]|nr:energy-coupled thiamine transporter ThiT [Thermofilaceae archaeon]MDW8004049.1 energy-coupled thiamine transporter ThiT [Thermofilaceae archaeon]
MAEVSKRSMKIRVIAEAAVLIALASVLSLYKIYRLPQGGSVTPASMVPILIFAVRRGLKYGVAAGLLFGLIRLYLGMYVVHPVQLLLDYPLAFGALGLAGLFKGKGDIKASVGGAALGIGGRFFSHWLSGVVFFAEYAPAGQHPAIYSAIYNGSYLGVEFIVSAVVMYMLAKAGVLKVFL